MEMKYQIGKKHCMGLTQLKKKLRRGFLIARLSTNYKLGKSQIQEEQVEVLPLPNQKN
jgi:hypothetical protein